MEGGVIHNDDRVWRKLWHQILGGPLREDVGIDVGCEKANGEKSLADQRPDDVGSALGMPIVGAIATLPKKRVTMRARHVVGEAAFVDKGDRTALGLVTFNPCAEGLPFAFVRFGVPQAFFYS